MAEQDSHEDGNSVSSRITLFNNHVEEHMQWQRINPFAHCSVRDMPKRSIQKEQYGTAPAGSLSEQRALQAQVLSLQEILQLCELVNEKGGNDSTDETAEVSLKFGELFELYSHISDKLLGTLLCARKHNYVDFEGETLFQGRDDTQTVRLVRPFDQLRQDLVSKIESLRCISVEKTEPEEHPELCGAHFS
ncbi:actin-binding Rho-activating protein [Drosophila grimshawi]|uniref:GH16995 n=1 Tax=Drosophila grimshawi TaxID=7222 RepID=B4IYI7_DROGR|nr:actin-binding Rho-activating protein [Drosophila grimshawi]EDV97660.1 GH16995 [Drosophila grimshawi]